jgi:hypothetical protein
VASFTPITINCPVCGDPIDVGGAPRLTSDRTPDRKGVVVFIEFNQAALERHAATHLTEEEAAA